MTKNECTQKSTPHKKRKSGYNSKRDCYLSSDGKHYCYRYYDASLDRMVTKELEIGRELSEELAKFLDSNDHDMDLNDRYAHELRDPRFDAMLSDYNADTENAVNPWDTIADSNKNPEEALVFEPEQENPLIVSIRCVIEEECTVAQQDLFFEHFGLGTSLETIRQSETQRIGKKLSHNAIPNRKDKIVKKVAKKLGVECVMRRKYTKKG